MVYAVYFGLCFSNSTDGARKTARSTEGLY